MLEIVINGSDELVLKETKLFKPENIISFSLLLSCGKIKNLKSTIVREVYGYKIEVQENLHFLKQKVAGHRDIRIWYSSLDNEDVCTLCFIINYLSNIENFDIYVCDVYDKEHFSLGSYYASEVSDLLNKTRKLDFNELKEYKDLWEKLEDDNGDLRIVSSNTLVSYSYDYLDYKIVELLKKYDSVYYWEFIGKCISLRLCNFYGDIFFTSRINEMIENGTILICEIKKEKNNRGEIVERKYIKLSPTIF